MPRSWGNSSSLMWSPWKSLFLLNSNRSSIVLTSIVLQLNLSCSSQYLKLYDCNLLDTQDVGLKFALLDAISEGKHTYYTGDTIQLSGFFIPFFSFSLGLCWIWWCIISEFTMAGFSNFCPKSMRANFFLNSEMWYTYHAKKS